MPGHTIFHNHGGAALSHNYRADCYISHKKHDTIQIKIILTVFFIGVYILKF